MKARHVVASAALHLVLFVVATNTSARVYEEAEIERKLAEAHEYAKTSRLAHMRKMVDEMEVIADFMERVVKSQEHDDTRADEADTSEPQPPPRPEEARDASKPDPPEEPADPEPPEAENEAATPEPAAKEGADEGEDEASRLTDEATDLDQRIDRAWRAALSESDVEPSSGDRGSDSQAADGTADAGISAMNATARQRLRDVLAAQRARDEGTDVAWDGDAAYWSQFDLDALGGRSPDEFQNRPDESELGRHQNGRSARLDNPRLRAEIERGVLRPGRAFLGHGDRARWVYIDSWYTIGPFPNPERRAHATRFPPEDGVDLDAVYVNSDGKPVEWTYVRASSPRVAPPTMDEYTVHYAYTEIRSDRRRKVWLALGSDDSVRAWLNGQPVWESEIHLKEWHLADGFRQVELRPGFNTLLIRLENAWGPGFFSASIRLGE